MDKTKEIREYIDKYLRVGYELRFFEDKETEIDYYGITYNVVGTSPNSIICSDGSGHDMFIKRFEHIFRGDYGLNPVLATSVDVNEPYNEHKSLFESINLNTLDIKQLDINLELY